MRRRNLIVTSDSDSDNADEVATASVASGGGGSQCRPTKPNPFPLPSSPPPSPPVEISDDDQPEDSDGDAAFVDVPDDFSPPAPASGPGPAPPPANPPSVLGDRLRPVDELLRGLGLRLRPEWLESCAAGIPVFDGLDAAGQARRCFEQLLFADMNACGAGALPEGVSSMHSAVLDGPVVLQVDEIVNISAPLKERYHDAHAGPKRCLKLSMTDGIQHVFGIEYRPIKALEILAPAGFKIIIRNVHVRRGLLMLVPEVIELLGGVVDELEAARDRLVSEVNKPPRGKRKQGGLPLSRRATLAAWQSNTNLTDGGQQGISTPGIVNPSHPTGLGNASQVGTTARTVIEHADPPVAVNNVQERSRCVQEITMQDLTPAVARNNREVSASVSRRFDSQCGIGGPSANDSAARSSNVDETIDPMEYLSGENEKPFTYLFCMMADWGTQQDAKPYIQGKIKGSFTGVKGFQYKQRRQYELHVYIDDGSLISEASVGHDVVQNKIGHSPEEVAAALASTDTQTVSEMREILKRFQRFLSKYEGTMLIELNRSSSLPIVREMNEGCSSSDAWDLFRRLKTFYARRHLHSQLDFMDTTP